MTFIQNWCYYTLSVVVVDWPAGDGYGYVDNHTKMYINIEYIY